ncbi:uncharacterized protein N7482_009333 [Penicillium canariense]|uniref:RecF/RecN/SMC N-terminal domain-containing protein n=1 Tax=Penicillium canariense TaxID=189055 RepID=A0A9W9LG65_9EURO|nr:uncharacterized protein N7482_009333 [Penicillium canariense]KAJ5152855.1 hypothetical protein N7482_009333 [Penicillium canariense]
MPSSKRVQAPSDFEDQSDGGSESAAVISSPHSRKRARTSASTSSSDVSGTNDRDTGSPSSPTDDALLDEDEDENELELRQTQIIQEKYAHLVDEANVPAEHGILERVECYNFMCHNHFSVELGPLINFIVGKNGSGKSAILTAITLCLGGKASATNRGQSLKSFIKEGKENASIIVRIKNQGDGAYLPDDYGKSIIVERHFSKSGSSGFKIKGDNGRIVSTKKAELESITDYFSLQIDNPMNVLSQDMARQFLSTSSAAEKYKFFVKGVQLEQLDQDYRLIEESVDQIEEKLRTKAQDIRILENRKDSARKKLEISDQHDSLRERIRNLRSQMAWAQVEDQERARDSFSNELAKADEAIASAEAALSQFDDALRAVHTESETAAEHGYRADLALEEARGEKEKMKELLDEEMNKRHELQAEQRQIREYLRAAETRISETQQKIESENQRLAEVSDGGYARKQEECEQATHRAAAARSEYEAHGQGLSPLQEAIRAAERKEQAAKELVRDKQTDIAQAESRLRELTKEDGQRRSGFPDKMPALLRAIQQERSFAARPVGPLGHHITLLQPKWAFILENALGTSLTSFAVRSYGDKKILSDIMRRVGCNCPILVGDRDNIDTSNHEPDSQYDTVLRILQIDNALARGHLIINHGIEQMLLIENLEEASSLLFDGQRVRNVKRCYCIDSRDRRRGMHLSYNREGGPSQAPVPMYTGHPRMKSDVASQISAQREVVQDLQRQLNDLKQECQTAASHVKSRKQAIAEHQRKGQELKIEMQQLEDHAEALRDALERENAEDGQIDALQAALKDAEDDLQLNQGSFQDSEAAMAAIMESLKTMRREISAKDRDLETLLQNSRVAKEEQNRVDNERRKILSNKNLAVAHIDQDKRNREKMHEKREQVAARVLDYTEKASLVSARVPVDEGETPDSLDQKLERLNRDLGRYNEQLGATRDEIAAEASRTEAAYQRAMNQVNEQTTLVQIFKDTLDNRKKRWEIFRSHISSRAKAQFTYLLSERSFRGRLLANHQDKLLDLQVEPDITKDDSTGRGAKTLSGGEKSFSQVCLLLALWEAMGSPIRCLDEFDVFMDHINRKMAIDMLMIAARRSIGRQFILITPGTKTDITIAPDVRVKELAEPERGQTTLAFQR